MVGMHSCAASMPAHGVSCSACCGLHLPADMLSHGNGGGASSLHLCMPLFGASYSGLPSTPRFFCDSGSGSVLSPCYASLSAQGSNALGCAMVAFSAPPARSMLVVSSVVAGIAFMSNNAPPGSSMSTTMHLMAFAVTAWLPRPGIRTYIFLAGLPTLLSRSVTSYLALYP
jgi:hypothetical protein